MSIKAFPLNQQEYSYNAQDVMKYYAGRNSGVFETGDNLKVSANGGLELRINTGMGWLAKDYVASVAFWNESVEYRMVEAGHDTYDRIDLVVVSWNFIQQEQNPKLIIRKGTPSSSPAVPSLVNDSSTIEIALARINVAKGAITLSDRNIVDLRGNDTYCPMVYDEQTIREAFRKCVGYADGVNKISDFPSVTPTSSDKLLIEQDGSGKSTTVRNLGKSIGINKELLWENSSPTSAFLSQNINISSYSYKMLIIIFKETTSSNYLHEFILNVEKAGFVKIFSTTNYSNIKTMMRAMVLTSNGSLNVKEGYNSPEYGSYKADDTVLIPFKIYGVK